MFVNVCLPSAKVFFFCIFSLLWSSYNVCDICWACPWEDTMFYCSRPAPRALPWPEKVTLGLLIREPNQQMLGTCVKSNNVGCF